MDESIHARATHLNNEILDILYKIGRLDEEIEKLEAEKLRIMQKQQLLDDLPVTDAFGNRINFTNNWEFMDAFLGP